MNIFEYDKAFISAIAEGNRVLAQVMSNLPSTDEDVNVLEKTNYDNVVYALEMTMSKLHQDLVKYRYDKMSKDEFAAILQNLSEGKEATAIVVSKEHQLMKFDTLQLLSYQYNLSVDEILSYNKMSVDEFEDKLLMGETIYIPETINIKQNNNLSTLPVFGSVNGLKALGRDWANEIQVDENGDIKALECFPTLLQGINNMFGEEGDIPGYEDYPIDLDWGKDLESELVSFMTVIKIQERMGLEPRIKEVKDVAISTSGITKQVEIRITPINSDKIIDTKI